MTIDDYKKSLEGLNESYILAHPELADDLARVMINVAYQLRRDSEGPEERAARVTEAKACLRRRAQRQTPKQRQIAKDKRRIYQRDYKRKQCARLLSS